MQKSKILPEKHACGARKLAFEDKVTYKGRKEGVRKSALQILRAQQKTAE